MLRRYREWREERRKRLTPKELEHVRELLDFYGVARDAPVSEELEPTKNPFLRLLDRSSDEVPSSDDTPGAA